MSVMLYFLNILMLFLAKTNVKIFCNGIKHNVIIFYRAWLFCIYKFMLDIQTLLKRRTLNGSVFQKCQICQSELRGNVLKEKKASKSILLKLP